MPRSSGSADIAGSRKVEPHTPPKRKRRRSPSDDRRDARRLVNQIQKTAHERHEAWLEGGQPNTTFRLTRELDEKYGDLRVERGGDPGEPFHRGDPVRRVSA